MIKIRLVMYGKETLQRQSHLTMYAKETL